MARAFKKLLFYIITIVFLTLNFLQSSLPHDLKALKLCVVGAI